MQSDHDQAGVAIARDLGDLFRRVAVGDERFRPQVAGNAGGELAERLLGPEPPLDFEVRQVGQPRHREVDGLDDVGQQHRHVERLRHRRAPSGPGRTSPG